MNKGKPKPKKVDKLTSRKEDRNVADMQVLCCNHVKSSDYICKEKTKLSLKLKLFSLPMPIRAMAGNFDRGVISTPRYINKNYFWSKVFFNDLRI